MSIHIGVVVWSCTNRAREMFFKWFWC